MLYVKVFLQLPQLNQSESWMTETGGVIYLNRKSYICGAKFKRVGVDGHLFVSIRDKHTLLGV